MVSQSCSPFQYALSCNVATIRITISREEEVGYLKFVEISFRIVDQRKPSRLSSSKLCAKAKRLDCLFGGFIERGETSAGFIFGEISVGGMKNIYDLGWSA
jgi:hypothetical protein